MSRKMDGEGLPRADCEAVSAVPGSWSDRPIGPSVELPLQASFCIELQNLKGR